MSRSSPRPTPKMDGLDGREHRHTRQIQKYPNNPHDTPSNKLINLYKGLAHWPARYPDTFEVDK